MKLSNLRLEHNVPFEYGKNQARIICDMQADFTNKKELWFSVDEEYADLLTDDVYDAFMVALLYPAMYYHEDIEIEGNVSKRLWHNIIRYVQSIVLDYEKKCEPIDIRPRGFALAKKSTNLHVGTGFSGGVDSFSTLTDNFFNENDSDYKIDSLFFFHLGQYGHGYDNSDNWKRANCRFEITKSFYEDAMRKNYGGGYCLMMNTNLFSFIPAEWEYDAGILLRIAAVLVFQKILKRYYISNSDSWAEIRRLDFTKHNEAMTEFDSVVMPLLSPDSLEILCDGSQYSRTEKTEKIALNSFAQKYLNVCVTDNFIEAKNCSICSKCKRTMFALETAGVLEDFGNVFDLSVWKKEKFLYKCECIKNYKISHPAKDCIDFARSKGKKLPSNLTANIACTVYRVAHIFKVALTNPKKVFHRLFSKGFDV